MFSFERSPLGVTDSAQHILNQIPFRASDRGLGLYVADHTSTVMLALWSVLLWERKLGLCALEKAGGNRFDLIRGLDRLLQLHASELPYAYDMKQAVDCDDRQCRRVVPKPDNPFLGWHSEDLLEPLLRQAQHEAKDLGHDYIGSEHLVLAIVKLADPMLSTLLREGGVRYEQVREAVVALLHPKS
jgi:Clp amino terminal domain, pathogenicity island component